MNAHKQRIQKILAAAGIGSRRACEDLVRSGRVAINGETVTKLPVLVDPAKDRIQVDGKGIRTEKHVYYLLHKPKGVFCTNRDPAGRMRAIDLLTGVRERVYPVGRLDAQSTGLLLMTNDGELTERLTHPRHGVEKTYQVTVKGRLKPEDIQKLRKGVWLSEGRTRTARTKGGQRGGKYSVLEIKLREGRNRQVRRMLARLGYTIHGLKRTKIGRLTLRGLGPGHFRRLTPREIASLLYPRTMATRPTRGPDKQSRTP